MRKKVTEMNKDLSEKHEAFVKKKSLDIHRIRRIQNITKYS